MAFEKTQEKENQGFKEEEKAFWNGVCIYHLMSG